MAPGQASKTIFVANIPYDVSEEQLANTFSEAGPVNNVEIKFDPQTGRSKGYAFVQFYDEATALSAVRNLQDAPVNGRNLRVELSTDEPGPRRGGRGSRGGVPGQPGGPIGNAGGPGGPPAGGPPGGYGRPQHDDGPPRGYDQGFPGSGGRGGPPPPSQVNRVDLNALPEGSPVPPGSNATDSISKTLAAVTPGQMQDVMASMKSLITTNPEQARQLLTSKPQLAYALFQAMLLMNIVDPSVLQRIQPLSAAAAPPPASNFAPPPQQNSYSAYPPSNGGPPSNYPPYPPANAQPPAAGGGGGYNRPPPAQVGYNPPPQSGYGAPPPQAGYGTPAPAPPASGMASLPPSAQQALATLPEDQQQMLLQVLQLTPDQISALDATQKASIMQLRQQFLGAAA
ncbi:uncharacterized protein I303_104067 [Kwoniella dejecticola CBS 10117]|uniref:RRM domain-containing protein n=1 Tax=Kwoniella dejecticola CBS 10117 TaxID=1296121 RepID=A0A1A6A8H7_9TREE|nr:uncharacterized protein I303_04086 [Kwoniella dejecticola CBS 10117]OBR86362.1 hypothetical protein I303_04086 [Kwoniella dejecticola CBS 10117]